MSDRDDAERSKKPRRRWTRRRFLKCTAGGALLAAGAGALEAFVIGPYHIEVTHPSIAIAGLPKAWEGVRVAQITDLHVGPLIGLDTIRRAVRMTNDESPDLIVATGDYVSDPPALDGELVNVLRELRAPMGKFAVLGNHDHWTGRIKTVNEMLVAAGFTLLTNTHAIIERDGDALCIAGVDDLWEGRQLIEQALAGVDERVPRILLEHNPDYAETLPASPRVDLMLCGHTHGGQFKIPFGSRPQLPIVHTKYGAGLVEGPRCTVYTSRGIGMVGIPIRFNCRPEIPVFTLTCRSV